METDWKKKYEDAMARMELCERTGLEKKSDYIFPELRESEDERIRTFLHHTFTAQYLCKDKTGKWHGEPVTNILAYLEKQKEQKEQNPKLCDMGRWDEQSYNNGIHHVLQNPEAYGLIKQKEQKPLSNEETELNSIAFLEQLGYTCVPPGEEQKPIPDWMPKFLDELRSKKNYFDWDEHRDIEGQILAIINWIAPNYFNRKEQEQKPAEKQDYSGLTDLERAIHRGFLCAGVENVPVTIIKETAQECLAEMKSAEWSEEDERMLNVAIKSCAQTIEDYPDKVRFKDCIDWLKSLRPQQKQEWSEDYREEDIQTRFAFYTYKDDSSVLYLSNVFVEETSRNHGFGTRILKAAEKAAEAIGAITICLKVKQDSPANAWYRKRGYGYVAFEDGYDWLEKNLEYLKPNKQEWNEEDEKILNLAIEWAETMSGQFSFADMNPTDFRKIIAWLKSLKNRGNFPKNNTNSSIKEDQR